MLHSALKSGDNITVKTYNVFGYSVFNGHVNFVKGGTFILSYFDNYFNKQDKITFEGYKLKGETSDGYMLENRNALGETKTIEIIF